MYSVVDVLRGGEGAADATRGRPDAGGTFHLEGWFREGIGTRARVQTNHLDGEVLRMLVVVSFDWFALGRRE
jgi:hypothetical protein